MFPGFPLWLTLLLSAAVSFVVAYVMTPPVKKFAETIGAIDVPKDARRVHTHPIPRMGGIAIFTGFVVSVMIFNTLNVQFLGLLLGATIIAVMGAVDDIMNLSPKIKLLFQVIAALVAIRCGIVFTAVSNPNFLSGVTTLQIGWLSIPLTIIWLVGCTNAVNLIDGLDGLAVGVSAISSATMLIVSLLVSSPAVSVLLAGLFGACMGFLPFNKNPAKIFMGDVGSQLLGFVLASISLIGLFKLHAMITFVVPVLAMVFPIADTVFAFTRRIAHGQSPFKADKGHFHHRLLKFGLSQKQAVAVIYGISTIFGLIAILLAGSSPALKVVCTVLVFIIVIAVLYILFMRNARKAAEKAAASENVNGGND